MAEATEVAFSYGGAESGYVAEYVSEGAHMLHLQRSAAGRLVVQFGVGGLDPVTVKAWGRASVTADKVLCVNAPAGVTVRVLSGTAVTAAYSVPCDSDE